MSSFDFTSLRSRFPLLDERLYFASQCFGPMPEGALADLDEFRRTLLLRKRAIPEWAMFLEELTGHFEALLNAPPGSVCVHASATAAQASLAASLQPRAERDRIVVASHDFHSTRYVWKAQARRGFRLTELAPRAQPEISVDQYVEAIDDRTALVEAALVSPRNGALLDAARVIRAAHDRQALVLLDAYQAVGVVPIDVQALGVDVLVGGTHKWLGGGDMGLAFMYVHPSLTERLEPAYPGWFGHASLMGFSEEYVPAPGARRFAQGSPAIAPMYTARAGVRLAVEVGVDHIRARSLQLTERMFLRAEERGLRVRTPRRPEARGGMLCFDVPEGEAVAGDLEDRGIDVDFRPGAGVRAAPHFCHREDECDRVVDAIAEAAAARS